MAEKRGVLKKYTLTPPAHKWLFRNGNEMIYADVFPQQPGQPEDQLTEQTVREGYAYTSALLNETPSGIDIVQESLLNSLHRLSSVGNEILQAQSHAPIPSYYSLTSRSSFQFPEKAVVTDMKRDFWINELASHKPLQEIQKVPVGFKPDMVLEICVERNVPMYRALWFIKCVGGQEMRGSKTATTPAQHLKASKEWTKTMMSLILRHLESISKVSLVQKDTKAPKDKVMTEKLKRWRYIISLCLQMFEHALLYPSEFLTSLMSLFQKCSTRQIPCMIPLIAPFVPEFAKSRYIIRQVSLTCIQKLLPITESEEMSPFSKRVYQILMGLLKTLVQTSPDTFVSLKLWTSYETVRNAFFRSRELPSQIPYDNGWKKLDKAIEKRNQSLFHNLVHTTKAISSMEDYLLHFHLDSNFEVLLDKLTETDLMASKANLEVVLEWAYKGYSHSHTYYRVFAACRILKALFSGMEGLLQDYLCQHLHVCFSKKSGIQVVHFVFANLYSLGIFSYFAYVTRLIADGSLETEIISIQKQFLLDFGLRKIDLEMLQHRRQVLGLEESSEIFDEKQSKVDSVKEHIRKLLGKMFANDGKVYGNQIEGMFSSSGSASVSELSKVQQLMEGFTYCMKFEISEWLKDSATQYTIAALSSNVGHSALNCQQYSTIVCIFEYLEDYQSLLELNLWIVSNSKDRWLFYSVISCLKRNRTIFCLIGGDEAVVEAIWEKFVSCKKDFPDQACLYFLLKWVSLCRENVMEIYSSKVKRELEALEKRKDFRDVHNESVHVQDIRDDPNKISKALVTLVYPNRSRDSVIKIFSYIFGHVEQNANESNPKATYRLIDICVFIFQEINSQSGFLDVSLVKFLKSIIQKALAGDINAVKSKDIWWLRYFMTSVISIDGISIRKLFSTVFQPLYQHCVENPSCLKLGSVVLLLKLFSQILYFMCGPANDPEKEHFGCKYVYDMYSVQFAGLLLEDSMIAVMAIVSSIKLLLQSSDLSEIHSELVRLEQLIVRESSLFVVCIRPGILSNYFSSSAVVDGLRNKAVDLGGSLLRSLVSEDFVEQHYDTEKRWVLLESIINSNNLTIFSEQMIMCLIQLELFACSDTAEYFTKLSKRLLDGSQLHEFHFGHIVSRFQDKLTAPLLSQLELIMEQNLNPLQNQTTGYSIKEINTITKIILGHFGYVIGDESKVTFVEEKLQICRRLISDFEYLLKNIESGDYYEASLYLRATLLRSFTTFFLKNAQTLPIVRLLQLLMSFLKASALQNTKMRYLFEILLDITSVLLDELPRNQQSELVQWVNENMIPYKCPNEMQIKLNTLLPAPKELCALQNIEDVDTDIQSRPWDLLHVGPNIPKDPQVPWNHPNSLLWLNNSCISLDKINAHVLRPGPSTFENLYANEWRPGKVEAVGIAFSEKGQKRPLEDEGTDGHASKRLR